MSGTQHTTTTSSPGLQSGSEDISLDTHGPAQDFGRASLANEMFGESINSVLSGGRAVHPRAFSNTSFSCVEPVPMTSALEDAITRHPTFDHLTRVRQMSVHYTSQSDLGPVTDAGLWRSRARHSLECHALATHIARESGMDERSTRLLQAAVLTHDIGHAPFSHAAETFLSQRFGFDHDAWGIVQLRRGALGQAIDEAGREHGISSTDVAEVLEENTETTRKLGFLAREVVDRLSYLLVDVRASRLNSVIQESLHWAAEHLLNGGIEVGADNTVWIKEPHARATSPMSIVLAARQALYEQYNMHPSASLLYRVMHAAVEDVFERGATDLDAFLNMTDRDVLGLMEGRFVDWFKPDPRSGQINVDAHFRCIASCSMDELMPTARTLAYFTNNGNRSAPNAVADLERHLSGTLPHGSYFVCSTPDYAKGLTCPIKYADGEVRFERLEQPVPATRRYFFVAVSNDAPQERIEAAQLASDKFMRQHLRHGEAGMNSTDLLQRVVDPTYFLEAPGSGGRHGSPVVIRNPSLTRWRPESVRLVHDAPRASLKRHA